MSIHRKTVVATFSKTATPRTYRVILYDATELDRDGETLDLSSVRAREPIPWQIDHDRSVLKTVGRVIGIHAEGLRLVGTAQAAPLGVSDLADQIVRQIDAGVTDKFSIGFLGEETRAAAGHVVWTNLEILELSSVSLPSSPGARVDQRALSKWLGLSVAADDEVVIMLDDEPDDELIVRLSDDDDQGFTLDDIAAAVTAAVPLVRAELAGDPATRGHHIAGTFKVDLAEVRAIAATVLGEELGGAIVEQVDEAVARSRGRVVGDVGMRRVNPRDLL